MNEQDGPIIVSPTSKGGGPPICDLTDGLPVAHTCWSLINLRTQLEGTRP